MIYRRIRARNEWEAKMMTDEEYRDDLAKAGVAPSRIAALGPYELDVVGAEVGVTRSRVILADADIDFSTRDYMEGFSHGAIVMMIAIVGSTGLVWLLWRAVH